MFNDGLIDSKVVKDGLIRLEIDNEGLDCSDRNYLKAIIDKYDGGPVGIDTLCALLSEEADTIESVIEPYLIMRGFVRKTPRGRVVTSSAYGLFGMYKPHKMTIEDF